MDDKLEKELEELKTKVKGLEGSLFFLKEWIDHTYSPEIKLVREFSKNIRLIRKETDAKIFTLTKTIATINKYEDLKKKIDIIFSERNRSEILDAPVPVISKNSKTLRAEAAEKMRKERIKCQ